MHVSEEKARQAEEIFREQGGTLRTHEAKNLGIHPRVLYYLRDEGRIEQLSRGVYRLADLPGLSDPDLVAIAARLPDAVVCLISALAFHGVTSEIPHEVHIALPPHVRTPSIDYPPVRAYHFGARAYRAGVETHDIDGRAVLIYCVAKTVADCIKFRNKIGNDVAIEALKLSLQRGKARPTELIKFAKICRVNTLMKTYLEPLV